MIDIGYTKRIIKKILVNILLEQVPIIAMCCGFSIIPQIQYSSNNSLIKCQETIEFSFNHALYIGIGRSLNMIILITCIIILLIDTTTSIIKFVWMAYGISSMYDLIIIVFIIINIIIKITKNSILCWNDILCIIIIFTSIIYHGSCIRVMRKLSIINTRIKDVTKNYNDLSIDVDTDLES
jgi:hypothetical protein